MPKAKPAFLTISIPTLNGAGYFEETVRSVARQLENLDDVVIIAIDNASTDSTPQICERLSLELEGFSFFRNPETLPFDANVNVAVAKAQSEYVWILADDDVVKPGAVAAARDALLEWKPEVALMNFETVDAELRPIRQSTSFSSPTKDPRVWTSAGEAILGAGFDIFGLLSAIIVKRSTWLSESLKQPIAKKDGFEFLFLVPRLMMLGPTVYLDEPMVLFRQYPKRWQVRHDNSQELEIFFVVIPRIFKRLLDSGFEAAVIKRLWRHHLSNLTLQIEAARKLGLRWNLALFAEVLSANQSRMTFWLQAPFILMPSWVLSLLKRLYENPVTANLLRSILRVPNKEN